MAHIYHNLIMKFIFVFLCVGCHALVACLQQSKSKLAPIRSHAAVQQQLKMSSASEERRSPISYREMMTPLGVDRRTIGWTLAGQGVLLNIAVITDLFTGGILWSPDSGFNFHWGPEVFQQSLEIAVPLVCLGLIIDRIPLKPFQDIAQDTRIFVLTLFGHSSSVVGTMFAAALVSIGAAVSEELFFRGIIYSVVGRYFGDLAASLISSSLFGLAHFPIFGANAFIEAVLGGAFAFSFKLYDYNIAAPIAIHALYDFFTIMIVWWGASTDLQSRIDAQQRDLQELVLNDSTYFRAMTKAVFDSLDTDKDGLIDERELRLGWRLYGIGSSFEDTFTILKTHLFGDSRRMPTALTDEISVADRPFASVDYETFTKVLEDGIKGRNKQ